MHQSLRIAEIVYPILECFDTYELSPRIRSPALILQRDPSSIQTLANLARTCRALQEPALDVLWRDIPDISVLVKHLLPSEFLKYDDKNDELLALTEAIAPAIWARLDPYIRRIRAVGTETLRGIHVRILDTETVLCPFLSYLISRSPGHETLFPNLRRVVYHPSWTDALYARLLLHPQLHDLQLPTSFFTPGWGAYVPVQRYEPDASELFRQIYPHIQDALQKMRALCTLWANAGILSEDNFRHLGTLGSLTGLAIENDMPSDYPPRHQLKTAAFTALKEAFISIAWRDAARFFAHITPASLETVTIYWEYLYSQSSSSGEVLQESFTELAHIRSPHHFHVVLDERMEQRIRPCHRDSQLETYAIWTLKGLSESASYLQPVLSLTSLRTLDIAIDVIFQLNNTFLSELARGLPCLESLGLTPKVKLSFWFDWPDPLDDDPDVSPLPTLDGLASLVEHCPNLFYIRLAVEGALSDQPGVSEHAPRRRSGHGMRTLELWATELGEDVPDSAVVSFFVEKFPGLKDFQIVLPLDLSQKSTAGDCESDVVVDPSRLACERWQSVLDKVYNAVYQHGDGGSLSTHSDHRLTWLAVQPD